MVPNGSAGGHDKQVGASSVQSERGISALWRLLISPVMMRILAALAGFVLLAMCFSAYGTVASALQERNWTTSGGELFSDLAFPNALFVAGIVLIAYSAGAGVLGRRLLQAHRDERSPAAARSDAS
jgi:hypothetical protein